MWDDHAGMGWWMVFGAFMWLFFIVVIVGIAVAVVRPFLMRDGRIDDADNAIAIVRQRYARGEIDRDEYEQLLRDLGEDR